MSSTPEQRLWRNRLRPALEKIPGLAYERIELRTGKSGIPDVVYTLGGTGWIENKVSDNKTNISLAEWRQDQRIWTRQHLTAGGSVHLCIGCPDRVVLLDPARCIKEKSIPFDHPAILATWLGSIESIELARLIRL